MTSRAGKVLVVTNDFPPRIGGIESFVYTLCCSLPSSEVVVFTSRMAGARQVDRALEYPVVRDRSRVLVPTPRMGRAVRSIAREHGCDRVLFGAAAPLGLLAPGLRRAGIRPLVALTHGHEVWWAALPGARAALRRIGDGVDVLTYVSEFCRERISPALSAPAAARMVRLSPEVDVGRFTPQVDGAPWRRRWRVGDRPVVLSAARLVARKGHDTLLRAWPRVLSACPDAVLVIVGDGPMRQALQRAVRREGLSASVRMVPGVPWSQMPGVYAAADVFALPCRTRLLGLQPEAFGIVFLEAAASGLPVVAGASGGVPETVLDGRTGYVVDPRELDQLVRRIVSLLSSPATAGAMGARGRREVSAHHAAGRSARVLRDLLDGDGLPSTGAG
ncbi:MAG: phosphatidyl-myo-inositol dimannoside synthase [Nocardioidaceae bacterium]|jgi:phosphatidylinositol alpha-1,6-mannosyltransferase|nr:phosphatidyl-myo-inositol dimannoside synthase [Nocardioidaceae bacterium]